MDAEEVVAIDGLEADAEVEAVAEEVEAAAEEVEASAEEAEAVEVVKRVEVDTGNPLPSDRINKETEKIASLLSEKWNVDEKTIEVLVEGGNLNTDG